LLREEAGWSEKGRGRGNKVVQGKNIKKRSEEFTTRGKQNMIEWKPQAGNRTFL